MAVAQRVAVVAIVIVGMLPTVTSIRAEVAGLGDLLDASNCRAASLPKLSVSGAKANCDMCVSTPGCKWCSLEQQCVKAGSHLFKGGESCMSKVDKIKSPAECREFQPPAYTIMDETFGTGWKKNAQSVVDGVRCVQWSLGWPVFPDKSSPGSTSDDEGSWGCMSVLLRDVLLRTLGMDWHWKNTDWVMSKPGSHSLIQEDDTQNMSIPGKPWYEDQETFAPKLCKLILLKFPGKKCYVRTWKIDEFRELMKTWYKTNDLTNVFKKISLSLRKGPLIPMNPGAGKSGSNFAMTHDGIFKIKIGLKYDDFMNEPEYLMNLISPMVEGVPSLVEHFQKHPYSLLNRPYGMVKLRMGDKMWYVVLMDDAFYNMDSMAEDYVKQGYRYDFHRYDLKGNSRDQTERKHEGYCLVNGDFNILEQGILALTKGQCQYLQKAIMADTEFLTQHNMIDYSIVALSLKTRPLAGDLVPRCSESEPFCMRSNDFHHLYTFSIIDYVNKFNLFKNFENKYGKRKHKFENYGERIVNFTKQICPVS